MKTTIAALLFGASLTLGMSASVAGINAQGEDENGINAQGINAQGMDPNGINAQGMDPNGINAQGINAQGASIDGLVANGTMLSLGLEGSQLVLVVYAGELRGTHVWVTQRGDTIIVNTYSRRGGFTTETHTRRGASFEFSVVENRSSQAYRLTYRGGDPSFNSMMRRGGIAASNGSNSDVSLYRLEYAVGNAWLNVCDEGANVVAVQGQWTDGVYSPEGISFACSGIGVAAKCIQQWGYKPWKTLAYGPLGVDLEPLFQSCVKAAMADYCGDGNSFTEQGTTVDIYDFYGFNVPASQADVDAYVAGNDDLVALDLVLESVLGATGTVAHHQERYQIANLPLYCNGVYFPTHQTEASLWDDILDNLMPWLSADQYGMDWPYVAVRSDPTEWPIGHFYVDPNDGLYCPNQFSDCPI